MINLKLANDKEEAIELGNEMLRSSIIQHVVEGHTFKNENLYYQFVMDLSTASKLETIINKQKRHKPPKPHKSRPRARARSRFKSQEEQNVFELLSQMDRVKQPTLHS